MIRLMGILTGAAIAVGLLIVLLGIPQLATEPGLPAPSSEPVIKTPPVQASAETELSQTGHATVAPQLVNETSATDLPEPAAAPTEATQAALEDSTPVAALQPANEAGWFAFWSPFRSEIAANGFVSELQRSTGLDYRVVKLKPGVYEVAFAYSDKSDIQDKLTRISAATGLDLSGG